MAPILKPAEIKIVIGTFQHHIIFAQGFSTKATIGPRKTQTAAIVGQSALLSKSQVARTSTLLELEIFE